MAADQRVTDMWKRSAASIVETMERYEAAQEAIFAAIADLSSKVYATAARAGAGSADVRRLRLERDNLADIASRMHMSNTWLTDRVLQFFGDSTRGRLPEEP